jgi:hypothetical protein
MELLSILIGGDERVAVLLAVVGASVFLIDGVSGGREPDALVAIAQPQDEWH